MILEQAYQNPETVLGLGNHLANTVLIFAYYILLLLKRLLFVNSCILLCEWSKPPISKNSFSYSGKRKSAWKVLNIIFKD